MAAPRRKLSKLEAVNIMLRAAREAPVSSLDEDAINESEIAVQLLDEWTLHEQAKGLYNNTFERDFTPDSNDEIILPPTTLYVTAWGKDMRLLVDAQEDGADLKLYNLEDEDFDFSDNVDVTLRLILHLDFEQLSPLQQRSIAAQAAHEYQMDTVGSTTMDQILRARASRARAEARAENIRKMRPNLFNNSRSNMGRAQTRTVMRPWWAEGDGRLTNRRL
jgi:hypothetical protein